MSAARKSVTSSFKSFGNSPICLENLESRQMMSVSHVHPAPLHDLTVDGVATVASAHHDNGKATHSETGLGRSHRRRRHHGTRALFNSPSITEPAVDGNVTGWTDVSINPLFSASGPTADDVKQGNVGDCYFLSALAEIAYQDPAAIQRDIVARGDGTFDVYFNSNGQIVDEHIDGQLPTNSSGQLEYAQFGQGGDTWVPLMEKAFTYFRDASQGASYAAIATGWPAEAFTALNASYQSNYDLSSMGSSDLFAQVQNDLSNYQAVEIGTTNVGGPLVSEHAYSVVGTYDDGAGNQYLQVRNPWGTDGPNNDGYQYVNVASLQPQLSVVTSASV